MRKRSSSPSTPSDLSATENYQAPDANDLAALLSRDKPDRRREIDYDSRESTPYIVEHPLGVDHWKLAARAARGKLEKLFGKPEADKIRQSISYSHYWQTEAKHYTNYWDLIDTTGKQRLCITSAILPAPSGSMCQQEPRKKSSQRPSGIRKRKEAPPSTPMITSRDAPVSSRLGSHVGNKQKNQVNEHLNGENARQETRLPVMGCA
ncbi:hypothetical protein MMC13_006077 [Lambiella insularis]|nr:hypothetical protein [Lambiella insularis]